MILFGYFPSDPRVRKEVHSLLKDKENSITIVCLNEDFDLKDKRIEVVPILPKITADK